MTALKRLLVPLKIGFTLLFLYLILQRTEIHPAALKRALASADPFWLILSLLIAAAFNYLGVIRWQDFLSTSGHRATRFQAAQSYFLGAFLGFISPGRLAEFGRGYAMEEHSLKDTALVTAAEKSYFVHMTLIGGIFGLIHLQSRLNLLSPAKAIATFSVLAMLTFILGVVIGKGRTITAFKGIFRHFPVQPSTRILLIILTYLLYILMGGQLYLVLKAFGPIHMINALSVFSLTLLIITLLPVSFGNLGLREGCYVYFLKNLEGFPEDAAFAAGLVIFFQNILLPSVLGLAFMIFLKLRPIAKSNNQI